MSKKLFDIKNYVLCKDELCNEFYQQTNTSLVQIMYVYVVDPGHGIHYTKEMRDQADLYAQGLSVTRPEFLDVCTNC